MPFVFEVDCSSVRMECKYSILLGNLFTILPYALHAYALISGNAMFVNSFNLGSKSMKYVFITSIVQMLVSDPINWLDLIKTSLCLLTCSPLVSNGKSNAKLETSTE
eukprot:NODE_455_length_8260_cov_0.408406.p5 type:complete len:107 gc:universal NODE_455_length_8260_cov_0.408406:6259-5939(-)